MSETEDTNARDAGVPAPRAEGVVPDRLAGVEVEVTVLAGRRAVPLGELGAWSGGTLVALDQGADAPLEIQVNGLKVATGELCEGEDGGVAVRILDVVAPS